MSTLSRYVAARAAARNLTSIQVDAVTDRYVAWIEGRDRPELAAAALSAVAESSKDPDRVISAATTLYTAQAALSPATGDDVEDEVASLLSLQPGASLRPYGPRPTTTVHAVTQFANFQVCAADDPRIRFVGASGIGALGGGAFFAAAYDAAPNDFPAVSYDVMVSGPIIEWVAGFGGFAWGTNVWVDGVLIFSDHLREGAQVLRIDMGTTGPHHVRVQTYGFVQGFAYDPFTTFLWRPVDTLGQRELCIGDSWTQGLFASGTGGQDPALGATAQCVNMLGNIPITAGVSGSGYVNNPGGAGQSTFVGRVGNLAEVPDIKRITFLGSINDIFINATPAAVRAAAADAYAAAAEVFPDAKVTVFGAQFVPAFLGSTDVDAYDDAVMEAAADAPNVDQHFSMREWALPPAPFIVQDGIHLNKRGYEYIASQMAQARVASA